MDIASIIIDPIAKKVPRPLNCFMTYRLEKQREILRQFPGTNHRDISKITAKWWKEMSAAEKEPYRVKAFNAKFEHEKKYPDYKFNPKQKLTKTRAYKKRTDESYSLQDIEQKQRLYTLYHEGIKPMNRKLDEPIKLEKNEVKRDICCATYFSSSKNCFSKQNAATNTTSMPHKNYYERFYQNNNSLFRLPILRQPIHSNYNQYPSPSPHILLSSIIN